MPVTPTITFASAADFTVRYDPRRLAQLIVVSGDPADPLPNIFEVQSSPLVLASLRDATEIILAASQVGRRYDRAHLEALAADYDPATFQGRGSLLVRLTCDIAYALMVAKGGQNEQDATSLSPRASWAENMLERLQLGERVFDIDGNIEAGKKIVEGNQLNIRAPRLSDDKGMFGCLGAFRRRLRSNGGCCG